MQKIQIIFIFLFSIVLFCSCAEKPQPAFTIDGQISGHDGDFILLRQETDIERKISELVDTIFVTNGEFKASFYDLKPYLYKLELDKDKAVLLALNKGDELALNIEVVHKDTILSKAKGSKDSEVLLDYEVFRKSSLDRLVKSVRREIKELKKAKPLDQQLIDSLGNLEVLNYELHLEELNEYIKTHMANSLGLYATSIRWKGPENLTFYDSLVNIFEAKYQNLEIALKIREKVTRMQQTAVGGIAQDINMRTAQDEEISLSSVNKKYTLIDFWASWCGPCRRESKSLNAIYEKYKDQGFEIYGVSLDDNRDKWLKALEKDHRSWPNVSSLERFKTPAAFDYAVTALPDNYLIDSNRKILAKNIHGEALEAMLTELLEKKN